MQTAKGKSTIIYTLKSYQKEIFIYDNFVKIFIFEKINLLFYVREREIKRNIYETFRKFLFKFQKDIASPYACREEIKFIVRRSN